MRKAFYLGVLVLGAMIGSMNAQSDPHEAIPLAEKAVSLDALPGTALFTHGFNHDGIDDLLLTELSRARVWLGDGKGNYYKPECRDRGPIPFVGCPPPCIPDCQQRADACFSDCAQSFASCIEKCSEGDSQCVVHCWAQRDCCGVACRDDLADCLCSCGCVCRE